MKSETRAVGHVVSWRGRSRDAEALKKHGAPQAVSEQRARSATRWATEWARMTLRACAWHHASNIVHGHPRVNDPKRSRPGGRLQTVCLLCTIQVPAPLAPACSLKYLESWIERKRCLNIEVDVTREETPLEKALKSCRLLFGMIVPLSDSELFKARKHTYTQDNMTLLS
jgi:hypothetical protein